MARNPGTARTKHSVGIAVGGGTQPICTGVLTLCGLRATKVLILPPLTEMSRHSGDKFAECILLSLTFHPDAPRIEAGRTPVRHDD